MDLKKEEYGWQRNLILFFFRFSIHKRNICKVEYEDCEGCERTFLYFLYIYWFCRCIMCVDVM